MPPLPKPASQRQRRNRTATAATLEAGPALKAPLGLGHHEKTIRWWDVIWASPMVDEWVDADVPRLLDIAMLRDALYTCESTADMVRLHAEIRMAEQQFGLSPLSRRSLQWEIKRVQGSHPVQAPIPAPRRASKTILSVLEGKGA